jgi:tetratricopeptide (TPR) repeat protein
MSKLTLLALTRIALVPMLLLLLWLGYWETERQTEQPFSDTFALSARPVHWVQQSIQLGNGNFLAPTTPKDANECRVEAKKLVELVVDQFPQLPDAYEVKGRMHFLLGELQAAQESWNKTVELSPSYIHAYVGLGRVALAQDENEKAAELFEKVLSNTPDYSADLYHDLAKAYSNQGNGKKAIETLTQYAELHPESADTFLRLGAEYMASREYKLAKQAYETTLQLVPDLPRAQEGLGRALVRLGDRERARELLEAQAEARSEEAKIPSPEEAFKAELVEYAEKYKDVAQVFLAGGDTVKAQLILEKAVVLDDTNTNAWSSLLGLYQRTNQIKRAQLMAEKMCEANPESASVFFTCGIINSRAGKADSAEEDFRTVMRLAPNSHTGYEALARLLIQTRKELPRTIDLASKAVELRGSAADHELLAQTFALNGKMQDARKSLLQAITLDPTNAIYKQALQQLEKFIASQNP